MGREGSTVILPPITLLLIPLPLTLTISSDGKSE